ncbi:MAG TPA: hypothetical protein VEH84_03805 [Alphaproteobacteria bacterium]|nr:hypothetical protein [Alphaproteobacteria bacterium]
MRKVEILGWLALAGFLAAAGWWVYDQLVAADNGMSGHGFTALLIGGAGSVVLAVLLMGLVFYSSRRGHDR